MSLIWIGKRSFFNGVKAMAMVKLLGISTGRVVLTAMIPLPLSTH